MAVHCAAALRDSVGMRVRLVASHGETARLFSLTAFWYSVGLSQGTRVVVVGGHWDTRPTESVARHRRGEDPE